MCLTVEVYADDQEYGFSRDVFTDQINICFESAWIKDFIFTGAWKSTKYNSDDIVLSFHITYTKLVESPTGAKWWQFWLPKNNYERESVTEWYNEGSFKVTETNVNICGK